MDKIIEVTNNELKENLPQFTENGKDRVDLERTQILSPMRRFPAGLINLNAILQGKYNSNSRKVFSKPIWVIVI